MSTIDPFDSLLDLVDPAQLPTPLIAPADFPQLGSLRVVDRGVAHTPLGTVFSFVLAFERDLRFDVPVLPLAILLGPASSDGTMVVRALLDDDWFVEIDRLTAALRFDPVLLRPVDPARPFAEVRVESGLRLTKTTLQFTEPGLRLTLPPSEIRGTGIIISIEGLAFDLSSQDTPPEVTELGYDPAFQGVFAERASIRLFPFLRLPNGETGLTLAARNIVIGTSGVSCVLDHSFVVDRTTFTGESVGALGDQGWPMAVASIEGLIQNNDPTSIRASGALRLPVFDLFFDFDLGVERTEAGDSLRYTAALSSATPAAIQTPFGSIQYDEVVFDAVLEGSAFEATGVLTGLVVDLDPLALGIESVGVRMVHRPDRDEIAMTMRQVPLGPLGQLDAVDLVVTERAGGIRDVRLEAVLTWAGLRPRIQVPDYLPMPADSARVHALVTWLDDPATGERHMQLTLEAELDDVASLWAFVPQTARPEVRGATLRLDVAYASTSEFSSTTTSDALTGSFGAAFELRLPSLGPFPGSDLLTLTTGNAGGWIHVGLNTALDAQGRPTARARIEDLVTLDLQLPAFPQAEPPVHLELTQAGFAIASPGGAADPTGTLTIGGRFDLWSIQPPAALPMATHLQRLLAPIEAGGLSGQATLDVTFTPDGASVLLECAFDDASVSIDIFALLANLAAGRATPPGSQPSQGEVNLDVAFTFALRRFALALTTGGANSPPGVLAELGLTVSIGSLSVDGHIRLSDRDLAIGITELIIPLTMPKFPLARVEIEALRTDADWQAGLDTRRHRIGELEAQPIARTNPELAGLRAQEFLLARLQEIRQRLAGPPNRDIYQSGIETIVGVLELVTGLTHTDSRIELVVENVQFVMPFGDPRDIRVEGSARLRGFTPGDPFRPLQDITLGLGLSADRIFFSTTSVGGPVPLPDLGRYPGGHVNLSRFTVGYGYTKNSLSVTVQGDIKLPRQLVDDADTSAAIGFGVRLPTHTSLNFRLDLVPVPGPLPVVPIFEFDLDMRSPAAPGILRTEGCEPFWDGLQLHVPGVFRAGVERIAFSPLFGILPLPNARFAGDLQIGDDKNGLTVVADNMLFLAGLVSGANVLVIPFLADPAYPYFDNLCVNLRFAGIGINFDIQRPFPSLSPLALFEVMGLISDPMMPVDPDGALANSMRVSLRDGRLTLPPEIVRMFPEARSYADKRVELTVNVGTAMTGLQEVMRVGGEMATALERGSADLSRRIDRLVSHSPSLAIGDIVELLPPELRKMRLGGSFAGFEARATLVIIDANDIEAIAQILDRRGAPASIEPPVLALGSSVNARQASGFRPNVPRRSGRRFDPTDTEANVFLGREFAGFTSEDLRAIPPPRRAQAGVIVAAHVKVFEAQRFRLVGALYEDGSFALISRLDIQPLELRIAGLAIRVPLRASGRLRLSGRARRDRVRGSVEAEASVRDWNAIPDILRMDVGIEKPVTVRLTSDGRFSFSGDARAILFGGLGVIEGRVDASHSHCLIEGRLDYTLGVVALGIHGRGRVGPGATFELAGGGSLVVGGVPFVQVKGRLTERSARVEGRLDTGRWRMGTGMLPCRFTMTAVGEIDLAPKRRPRFLLEGAAELTVFDATLKGRGRLSATGAGGARALLEGALLWQGREWLGGRIEMVDRAVTIAGRTSLAFNLTPSNFAGVEVANLFFKLDVEGEFSLDASGGLTAFGRVKGDWMLAVQFPNRDSTSELRRQAFPIAMQSFSVGGGVSLQKKLLEIRSMRLPFDITLPSLEVGSNLKLRFHKHGVEIPGVGGLRVLIPEIPGSHTPESDQDPFPFLLDGDVAKKWVQVATIPTSFRFSDEVLKLPASLNFNVFLVWKGGKLAIDIREV